MCSPTPSASIGQPPFTTHHITTNLHSSSIEHPASPDSASIIHHTCTSLHCCAGSNNHSGACFTPTTTCTSLHCCASSSNYSGAISTPATTCNDLHTSHVCQVIPICDLTGALSRQRRCPSTSTGTDGSAACRGSHFVA